MVQEYTVSTLPSPAESRMGQAAPRRQDGAPPLIPSGSLGASVPATAGLGQIKD